MKYSFGKNERLCSKKLIELLFANGQSFLIYPLKVTFLFLENATHPPGQVLIIVSRKRFRKAVQRNRIKRLLREAYRLEKAYLYDYLNASKINCLLAVSYIADNELNIIEIRQSIQNAFKRIIEIHRNENTMA